MPTKTKRPRNLSPLKIERHPARFESDDSRVINLPFTPGGEARMRTVVERIKGMSEHEVDRELARVMMSFRSRHTDIERTFEENFLQVVAVIGEPPFVSQNRKLLIGAYFTMEYAVESAALFNPSIVPHIDQSGVETGGIRFIMSLRATGEGHLSSIVFRTGTIQADGNIEIDAPQRVMRRARLAHDQDYDKKLFSQKLDDLNINREFARKALSRLGDHFTLQDLEHAVEAARQNNGNAARLAETIDGIRWLARSNYQLQLPQETDPSQVVIFPTSETEARGIEDLRLVQFTDDDGRMSYIGTYTAYSGYNFLPQLIETRDFRRIGVHTLNGKCVQNKGMALFPRRIGGHYCMSGRIDGENLYIMYSDMLHFWESAELLVRPKHPWEFMQIGNCGSPIETPAGWLLLTHGVGPVRQYCIGAMLLDLNDPMKIVGHLEQPLLMPAEDERDGYVPNVVYTCGAMAHNGRLYLPYAMSDIATRFASVSMDDLLERLVG